MAIKDNLIQKKSFEFSLSIIRLFKRLQVEREYIISKQLLRSGTSIGANIEEAIAGQSKKDFWRKFQSHSKKPEKRNIGYDYFRKVN